MTGKQNTVLWIGLILIAFNLVRKWKEISGIIFSGAVSPATSNQGTSGSGGGHSVTVPIDPLLPTGPKITIPIPLVSSLVMAVQKVTTQSGYDVVVTTAFELIGVGLMALLAGTSDQMGTIVVIVMVGFLLGWLLLNSGTLSSWVSKA